MTNTVSLILGQGIAGSVLAWELHWCGDTVHLIDRCESVTASKIAAGLITPVTGQRLTKADDFDAAKDVAVTFYRRVEQEIGRNLLTEEPSIRLFKNAEERSYFMSERSSGLKSEVEVIHEDTGEPTGFRMLNAARLRVKDFLKATADFFASRGRYHKADVDVNHEVTVTDSTVEVAALKLVGTRLFFCQGYQASLNRWFPGIPDTPARGEILQLQIDERKIRGTVHKGYWLTTDLTKSSRPGSNNYVFGATYDRNDLISTTTAAGYQELIEGLATVTEETSVVKGHQAAIRASMKNRQPVIAVHAEHPNLAIMNGMGSKASLMAPITARRLIEAIKRSGQPVRDKSVSVTKLAHSIVRRAINAGDFAIDATAGNGHDTLFLARCVTETGQVLGIDIQTSAIETTLARLRTEGITHVTLEHDDHSTVLSRLTEGSVKAGAIMFNLGYLPGSDKTKITSAASTGQAIRAGLELLQGQGVMTVIAYRGHEGGREEAGVVDELSREAQRTGFGIDVIPGSASNDQSPILYVFRRKQQ